MKPSPGFVRISQKRASRVAILAAAKEIFLSRGYAATTLRDIAAKAGVSPGLVFSHVADKQELLQLVLHRDLEEILEKAAPDILAAESTVDLLTGLARTLLDYYGRHPELSRSLIASVLFQPAVYGAQLGQLRDIIDRALARDVPLAAACDHAVAAELLVSRYLACVIEFLGHDQPGIDEQVESLAAATKLILGSLGDAPHD
ncbi:MAG: TetR/AcrR family transcriptional regulator [Sphingomonas sp.]|nr:TetR/AcrR family transcriptional regulator [Sphingomonas sp.]